MITPVNSYEILCRNCNNKYSYEQSDLESNGRGVGFYCPNCKEWIPIGEQIEPFTFPQSFYHFGNAYLCNDEEVQEFIDRVKKHKNTLKSGEFVSYGTGDTEVIGMKYADSFEILVAKNYWVDEVEV